MLRTAFLVLVLSCASAAAQTTPTPPNEAEGRVMFERVQDGYLRLDTRSGKVSLCARRNTGWVCEAVPEERTAFESEIVRLRTENSALRQELASRGLRPPETIPPGSGSIKLPEVEIRLPSSADIDRAVSYLEKVWRRLVDMIAGVQKEILKT